MAGIQMECGCGARWVYTASWLRVKDTKTGKDMAWCSATCPQCGVHAGHWYRPLPESLVE